MLHFRAVNISSGGDFPSAVSSVPPVWRGLRSPPSPSPLSSPQRPNTAWATDPHDSSQASPPSLDTYERLVGMEFIGSCAAAGTGTGTADGAFVHSSPSFSQSPHSVGNNGLSPNASEGTCAEQGAVMYFFTLLLASCNGKDTSIDAVRCSFSEGGDGDMDRDLSKDTEMDIDDAHTSTCAFPEETSSASSASASAFGSAPARPTGDDFLMNLYPDLLLEQLWDRFCAHKAAPGSEAPSTAAIPSSSSFAILDRTPLFLQEGFVDIVHASLATCEDDMDVLNRSIHAQNGSSRPSTSSMPSSQRASWGDGLANVVLLSFTERMNAITAVRAMPECGRKSRRTFASLRRFVERERNKEQHPSPSPSPPPPSPPLPSSSSPPPPPPSSSHSHEQDKQHDSSSESSSLYRYVVWLHVVGTSVFHEATVTELVNVPHDLVFSDEPIPTMRMRNTLTGVMECGKATRIDSEEEEVKTLIEQEVEEESESATRVNVRSARAATLSPMESNPTETEVVRCLTIESSLAVKSSCSSTTRTARMTRLSGSQGAQCFGDTVMVPANAFCQSGYFLRNTTNLSQGGRSSDQKNDAFTFYWLFACDYSRHGLQVKQVSYVPYSHSNNTGTHTKSDSNSMNACGLSNSTLSATGHRRMKITLSAASLASPSMQGESMPLQFGRLDVRGAAQWTLAQYPQWHHWDPVTQRLFFWAAFSTFDKLRIVVFDGHPERRRCEFERNLTRRRRHMPDPLAGMAHATPLARGFGVAAESFVARTHPPAGPDPLQQSMPNSVNIQVNSYSHVDSGSSGHPLNEAWGTAGASTASRQHMCLHSIRYEDGVADLILCEQFFTTPSMHAMRLTEGIVKQEVHGGAPPSFFNTHATSNVIHVPSDFSVPSVLSTAVGLGLKSESNPHVPSGLSDGAFTSMASSQRSQHICSRQELNGHRHHSMHTVHNLEGISPCDGHHLSSSQSLPTTSRMNLPFTPQPLGPPAIMCTITALRNYADALQLTIPLLPEERLRITHNTRVCFLAMNGMIVVYLPGVCVHYIDVHHKDVPPQYLFGVRLSSLPPSLLGAVVSAPLVASLPTPNGRWLYVPGTAMLFEARLRPTSVWEYIAHRLARRRACRMMACGVPNKACEVLSNSACGLDWDSYTKSIRLGGVGSMHPALCAEAMDPAPLQHALHVALTHFPILAQVRHEQGKHRDHQTYGSTGESSTATATATEETNPTNTNATSTHRSSSITPLLLEWETIWSKRDAQLETVFRSLFTPTALWRELTVEFISALVMAEAYERTRAICHWRPSLSHSRGRQRRNSASAMQWNYWGNPFFAALPLWDSEGMSAEDTRFRREAVRYYAVWRKHTAMHERESQQQQQQQKEEEQEKQEEKQEEEEVDGGRNDKDEAYRTATCGILQYENSTPLMNERNEVTQSAPRTNVTVPIVPLGDSIRLVHPQQQQGGIGARRAWESERRSALLSALLVHTTSQRDIAVSRQQCHNTVPEWWLCRGVPLCVFSAPSNAPPHVRLLFTSPAAMPTAARAGGGSSLLHKLKGAFRSGDKGSGERSAGRSKSVVTSPGTTHTTMANSSNDDNNNKKNSNNGQSSFSMYNSNRSSSKYSNAASALSVTPLARMTLPIMSSSSLSLSKTTGTGTGNTGHSNIYPARGLESARELSAGYKASRSNPNLNNTALRAYGMANTSSDLLIKSMHPSTESSDATAPPNEPQQQRPGVGQGRDAHLSSSSSSFHHHHNHHSCGIGASESFDGSSCGTAFVESVLDQLNRVCLATPQSSSGQSQLQQSQQQQQKQQQQQQQQQQKEQNHLASEESFVSSGSPSLSRFLTPASASSFVSWIMSPANVKKSAAAQLALLALLYDAAMASVVNVLVRVANTENFSCKNCTLDSSDSVDVTWSALDRWNFLQSLALALDRIGVPLSQELTKSLARHAMAKLPVSLLLSAPRFSGTMSDLPSLFRHSPSLTSELTRHIMSFTPYAAQSVGLFDASQLPPRSLHDIVTPNEEAAMAEAISQSLQRSSCTVLESTTGRSGYSDASSPILTLHGAGLAPELMERMQLCGLVVHAAPTQSCTTAKLREWKWHLTAALDPGPFLQHGDERSIPMDTEFSSPFPPFQWWWRQKKRTIDACRGTSDICSVPPLWPSQSSGQLGDFQHQLTIGAEENEGTLGDDEEGVVCIPQLLAETSLGHALAKERAKAAMAVVLDPFFKSD